VGDGDFVDLRNNPLSDESANECIPEHEARGVAVDYEDSGDRAGTAQP